MKLNELKTLYEKLKNLEYKRIIIDKNPFSSSQNKTLLQSIQNEIFNIQTTLSNYNKIKASYIEQSIKEYFKNTFTKASLTTSVTEKDHRVEYFEGIETQYLVTITTHLTIEDGTKDNDYIIFKNTFDSAWGVKTDEYYNNNYNISFFDVLDMYLSNDPNENHYSLKEKYPDLYNVFWNAYKLSVKTKYQKVYIKKENEKNLLIKKLNELKNPNHIKEEINNIEKQINKINFEQKNLKLNEIDI